MLPALRRATAGALLALSLLAPAASANLTHAGVQATGPGGRSLIAPGDTISILESVRNDGSTTVSGLSGTLSSNTAGVTVPSSGSTFPSLAPGAQAANNQPFTAMIPDTLACGATVSFALAMSGGSSDTIGFNVSTGIPGPPQAFPTLDGALNVPDSGERVQSTVDVPSSGRINNLRVHVNRLLHSSDRDMSLVLIGPDGTSVTLLASGQAAGSDFSDTIFEPVGGTVGASSAPYTGRYRATGDLTRFLGKDQRGLWKLELTDNSANGSGGLLDGWSLEIDPPVCDAVAQASFTATPNTVGAGDVVHFDARQSQNPQGNLAHYVWRFGDGTPDEDTGTTPTVDHQFDLPRGRKSVTLEMQDAGRVVLSQATVNVFVDQAPAAVLSAPSSVADIDAPCTLDASGSTFDPAADTSRIRYDFDLDGDGVFETPGTTPTRACEFTTSGPHTVRVRVTDDVGASSVAQKIVSVGNLPPVAAFTAPSGWLATGAPVALDASASSDRDGAGGKPATYQWDFDYDGSTPSWDTQPLPGAMTSFSAVRGVKTVLLRIVDAQGASSTATRVIQVTDPPSITLAATPNPAPKDVPVRFSTTGSSDPDGTIARWDWDLNGDGVYERPDAGPTQTQAYTTFGSRNVRVRATDDHGVQTVRTLALVVANRAPVAQMTATPNPVQTGQTVTLDASGSYDPDGPVAGYRWDLDGDGVFETTRSTSPTATAAYPNAGYVDVAVEVTDADGGTAVRHVAVTIVAPPPPPTGGGSGGGSGTPGTPGSGGGATGGSTGATGTGPGSGTTTGSGPGAQPAGTLAGGLSGAAVQSIKIALRKGVALVCQVDRAATCTVSLTIRAADARRLRVAAARGAKTVVIGTATLKAPTAGAAKMTVRLKPAAAKRLKGARKLVVRASGTARDAAGSTVKLNRSLLLRG
ncbi:MAG: PKD domain-containing protein [Solirubrobacteraceae bacterium]